MRTLHHFALSPFCRKVRLALGEKRLPFTLAAENPYEGRDALFALNPAGTVPVLVDEGGIVVPHSAAICEYLEEVYPVHPLIPGTAADRAEIRRLTFWFDEVFHREVTVRLLYEKVHKRFYDPRGARATPELAIVRAGSEALREHLDAISQITEVRRWLAGDALSIADLAAAGHLSALDYLGDVPWGQYEPAKEWFVRLKSRPCFRALLSDVVPGMPPVRHYADLDF
ncbi:MAG: glutathione S-transferase family protein [Alphaproteobacteria bacterium]|nr:glutathione S-transferase family protein [Alphaproteobacteria bacterium]